VTEAKEYVSKQLIGMAGDGKISAALAKEAQNIQAKGGIKSVDVKLDGKGEVRTGTATITFKNAPAPKIEKVKVIQEDGKWKITAEK